MLCFDFENFKVFELKYILKLKLKCNIFNLIRYFFFL